MTNNFVTQFLNMNLRLDTDFEQEKLFQVTEACEWIAITDLLD